MMPLSVYYQIDQAGITVPYPAVKDAIRDNRGFIDLRGKPEDASLIAEAVNSPALRKLLVQLAQKHSPIISLGCDLGGHLQTSASSDDKEVAGGYVQIAPYDWRHCTPEMLRRFAKAVAYFLRNNVGEHRWELRPTLACVRYRREEIEEMGPSIWFWFWCFSETRRSADESRETLLSHLSEAFVCSKSLKQIACRSKK